MLNRIKQLLYFPIASYFRFFAKLRLQRWNPKIIVVTGSNGKTTLLHMLESQIGEKARFSHHANSAFGVCFDILDLHRKTLKKSEWLSLFINAPRNVFKPLPKETIYVVEADADRPYEGVFLATLLQPDVVLWVSTGRTHSMNYDSFVIPRDQKESRDLSQQRNSDEKDSSTSVGMTNEEEFETVEEAIAYEYGYFLKYCRKLAVIDGDSQLEREQLHRTKAEVQKISGKNVLKRYAIDTHGTTFEMEDETATFKALLPKEAVLAIAMSKVTMQYLDLPYDKSFENFVMPAGRGSVFMGIKDITILDSSYNLSPASLKAILVMYNTMQSKKKWLVVGDLLELGKSEQEEHEKLAQTLAECTFERIILMGPRVKKYTYPILKNLLNNKTHLDVFENPKEVLDFLLEHIQGGETILFKGARFMEGIIEHLLKDKSDVQKLARREEIWKKRRKQWGL